MILSELREALAAYPLETPEQSETIVAAAREYEPLVEVVTTFASETGKTYSILRWVDSQ